MRRLVSAGFASALLLTSCSQPPAEPVAGSNATASPISTPSPSPAVDPSPTPAEDRVFLPDPDRRLPTKAFKLAREVERVNVALKDSIARWRSEGDIYRRAPKAVVLQALYHQRLVRRLSRSARLTRRVVRRLDGRIASSTRLDAEAGRQLRSLVTPVEADGDYFDTQRPVSAGRLLDFYRKAQRRFGVDWEILAAINYVETRFGRISSSSSAGAQGPMQFLPSTWEAYGMGGDIHDPHDAIMGAANYLRASGAPGDYPRALYAYNHAEEYVRAILIYARRMMRDPARYFVYYNHQVFVATTKGDVRLTGPK